MGTRKVGLTDLRSPILISATRALRDGTRRGATPNYGTRVAVDLHDDPATKGHVPPDERIGFFSTMNSRRLMLLDGDDTLWRIQVPLVAARKS